MGKQSEVKKLIAEARNHIGEAQRDLTSRGLSHPAGLQQAHEKLGQVVDYVREALKEAAATGKTD